MSFGGVENKRKCQQYEFNSDFDLNLYESFHHTHDPQLVRLWQIHPKPTDIEILYAAMKKIQLGIKIFWEIQLSFILLEE